MNMISAQIQTIRDIAKYGSTVENVKAALNQAADTIEALSAKLQAVNEELNRWHTDHINEKIKNPLAHTSTLICHNCDHKDEYIEELEAEPEELKTANMENGGGWIACEDRLPEIRKPVLICDTKGNVCIRQIMRIDELGMVWWSQYSTAIAWQPLPEPYRP